MQWDNYHFVPTMQVPSWCIFINLSGNIPPSIQLIFAKFRNKLGIKNRVVTV